MCVKIYVTSIFYFNLKIFAHWKHEQRECLIKILNRQVQVWICLEFCKQYLQQSVVDRY